MPNPPPHPKTDCPPPPPRADHNLKPPTRTRPHITVNDDNQQRDAALAALTERIARWTEGGERLDAANAAFQVCYESPSQFSREYRRMFGAPPLRDISQLRQASVGEVA